MHIDYRTTKKSEEYGISGNIRNLNIQTNSCKVNLTCFLRVDITFSDRQKMRSYPKNISRGICLIEAFLLNYIPTYRT